MKRYTRIFSAVLLQAALFTAFVPAYALEKPAFETLAAMAAEPPAFPAKNYAVSYVLRGIVTLYGDKAVLNTADGRVFELKMDAERAAEFDDKIVEVSGKVKASDDLDVLKVQDIREYSPDASEITPPPYKSRFRPLKLISETPDTFTLDDVRWTDPAAPSHDFLWGAASLRPEMVKKVYFVTKKAGRIPAGHSLLYFDLSDGGFTDARGLPSKGFFLSVEAYAREGQSYSVFAGFKKTYGIVWMFLTFEEYAIRTASFEEEELHFYPVLVGREDAVRMAREAVRLAAVNREGEYYHSTRNNCTNNLVIVMNRVLPEEKKARMWAIPHLIYNFRATTPMTVPSYLKHKGALGEKEFAIDKDNLQEYLKPLPAEAAQAAQADSGMQADPQQQPVPGPSVPPEPAAETL